MNTINQVLSSNFCHTSPYPLLLEPFFSPLRNKNNQSQVWLVQLGSENGSEVLNSIAIQQAPTTTTTTATRTRTTTTGRTVMTPDVSWKQQQSQSQSQQQSPPERQQAVFIGGSTTGVWKGHLRSSSGGEDDGRGGGSGGRVDAFVAKVLFIFD
jgi:hypothetical protein